MREISFPTRNPFTLAEAARAKVTAGKGYLSLPAGAAEPSPAVVVIEGLGGLQAEREMEYGRKLAQHGFASLVVDSFGPRGLGNANHEYRALRVTESMMLADAFAALRYLRTLPEVMPHAVGVIGFSYGGMISVLCAYEQIAATFASRGERFAAHVSFYGTSAPRLEDSRTTGAPVLMFLGERDRNVSVPRSHDIADDLRRGGSPATVRVLPNVYHQWNGSDERPRKVYFALDTCRFTVRRDGTIRDERSGLSVKGPISRTVALALGTNYAGYTILRDEDATARADAEMLDFLREALARPRQDPISDQEGKDHGREAGATGKAAP